MVSLLRCEWVETPLNTICVQPNGTINTTVFAMFRSQVLIASFQLGAEPGAQWGGYFNGLLALLACKTFCQASLTSPRDHDEVNVISRDIFSICNNELSMMLVIQGQKGVASPLGIFKQAGCRGLVIHIKHWNTFG